MFTILLLDNLVKVWYNIDVEREVEKMKEIKQKLNEIFKEYIKDFSEEEFNYMIREEIDDIANTLSTFFSEQEKNHIKIIKEVLTHNKDKQSIIEHSLQKDILCVIHQVIFKALAELREETK